MNFQFMWWSVVPRLFILTLALPNQGMAIGVINIMKKVFVKPEMEVLEIERTTIIAESATVQQPETPEELWYE